MEVGPENPFKFFALIPMGDSCQTLPERHGKTTLVFTSDAATSTMLKPFLVQPTTLIPLPIWQVPPYSAYPCPRAQFVYTSDFSKVGTGAHTDIVQGFPIISVLQLSPAVPAAQGNGLGAFSPFSNEYSRQLR